MQSAATKLSDHVETLQSLLLTAFEHNEALREENRRFHARVETLQEQLNLALARRYAASSEKISGDQLRLFDEAEVDAEAADDAPAVDVDPVKIAAMPARCGAASRSPMPCPAWKWCMSCRSPSASVPMTGGHISMEALLVLLSPRAQQVNAGLVNAVCVALSAFVGFHGWQLAMAVRTTSQVGAASGLRS